VDFAARIVVVSRALPKTELASHIGLQLGRAATSAGANYSEACSAESKRDFIHKMQIVAKELRETEFWLRVIGRSQLVPPARLDQVLKEANELIAISVASSRTAASGLPRR